MKNIMLAGIVATTAAFGFAGAASAATKCQTSYLLGTWVGTAAAGDDDYCIVQFKKNGWIVQASCFDDATLKSQGTLDGRFQVTKDCKVTANFDVLPTKGKKVDVEFTGTMDPNKGTMTGTVKTKGQPAVKYNYVQQW